MLPGEGVVKKDVEKSARGERGANYIAWNAAFFIHNNDDKNNVRATL